MALKKANNLHERTVSSVMKRISPISNLKSI